MDQMKPQNSALVEEASSSAESLQEQAVQLGTALAVFKLAPAGAPAITSAPTVRRLALAQAA